MKNVLKAERAEIEVHHVVRAPGECEGRTRRQTREQAAPKLILI